MILRLDEARSNGDVLEGDSFTVIRTPAGELLFYVDAPMPGPESADRHLIEMFCRNVAIAHKNLREFTRMREAGR